MAADNERGIRTFGHIIRERRRELGFTQEELAARVGDPVRQSDISRLEHDYVKLPRRDRLEALAAALDVSPGFLLLHSGWMTTDELTQVQAPSTTESSPRSQEYAAAIANGETSAAVDDAVERAREVVRQTDTLLQQSATTLRNARRRRGTTA